MEGSVAVWTTERARVFFLLRASEEDSSPLGPTGREQEDMRPLGNRS